VSFDSVAGPIAASERGDGGGTTVEAKWHSFGYQLGCAEYMYGVAYGVHTANVHA